jgi:hypothetical protein
VVSSDLVNCKSAVGLAALALLASGCNSPARSIRPVIHAHQDDKYEAMKSAPIVVLAEVLDTRRASANREVGKPPGMAGPQSPTIPCALLRISARVMLSLRGDRQGTVQVYSWRWAGQMHGGPRLFSPNRGSFHVLFLRQEAGYLHTVGDYPTYDMAISPEAASGFRAELKSNPPSEPELSEGIVRASIIAELKRAGNPGGLEHWLDLDTLAGLTSPLYIASMLDAACRQFPNPLGQFAACLETARNFDGRCNAYRIAMKADPARAKKMNLQESFEYCRAFLDHDVQTLRARKWPLCYLDSGWRETAERRRLGLRYLASAIDPEIHEAACEMAASTPEGRDIPECASLDASRFAGGAH